MYVACEVQDQTGFTLPDGGELEPESSTKFTHTKRGTHKRARRSKTRFASRVPNLNPRTAFHDADRAKNQRAFDKKRKLRGFKPKSGNSGKSKRSLFNQREEHTSARFTHFVKEKVPALIARKKRVETGTEFPARIRRQTAAKQQLWEKKVASTSSSSVTSSISITSEQNCKHLMAVWRRTGDIKNLPCCLQHLDQVQSSKHILNQKQYHKLRMQLLQRGCVEVHPGPEVYDLTRVPYIAKPNVLEISNFEDKLLSDAFKFRMVLLPENQGVSFMFYDYGAFFDPFQKQVHPRGKEIVLRIDNRATFNPKVFQCVSAEPLTSVQWEAKEKARCAAEATSSRPSAADDYESADDDVDGDE